MPYNKHKLPKSKFPPSPEVLDGPRGHHAGSDQLGGLADLAAMPSSELVLEIDSGSNEIYQECALRDEPCPECCGGCPGCPFKKE